MKATWNGTTLAESDDTVVVEGNHYFPPESVHMEYFSDSDTHTICPWKGEASYKTIQVDGQTDPDAAWSTRPRRRRRRTSRTTSLSGEA